MAPTNTTKQSWLFNVTHPALTLILWDIFLGIPISFLAARLNKAIFSSIGWENFMRNPGGARVNKAIFLIVNIWCVVGWAMQIREEKRREREERLMVLGEHIRGLEGAICEMGGALVEEQIHGEMKTQRAQSKARNTSKIRSPSEVASASKIPVPEGDARLRRFNPISEQKKAEIAAWKKDLRRLEEAETSKKAE